MNTQAKETNVSELTVPWLRSGAGQTPADGGCILQVIDWIDRNEWTDKPVCVHPAIAKVAIYVNDQLDDKGRQKLLDLAPRIMGTASDDKVLSVRLAVFAAKRVLPIFEAKCPGDSRPADAMRAAEAWCDNPCKETQKAAAAHAASAAAAKAAYAVADAAAAHAASAAAAKAAYAVADAAYAVAAAAKAAHAAAVAAYAAAVAADAAYAADAVAAAAAAAKAAHAAAYAAFDLLVALLDEYDRLTGRTQTDELDYTPVCRMLEAATA